MNLTKETLLQLLQETSFEYQVYEHPPIFTVEEAKAMEHSLHCPGAHVKNLFLRNHKKTFYCLLTVKEDKTVDLSTLSQQWDVGRFSFASPADLERFLQVSPGSVTPFAILNDTACKVKLYFDEDLLNEAIINIHPMVNTATIGMKREDLVSFLEKNHHEKITFIHIPSMEKG